MPEADPTDPEWILTQLQTACEELRTGSLIRGVEMTETTRDQLQTALEGETDTGNEDQEE